MKKILLIFAVIAVVAAGIYFGWRYLLKPVILPTPSEQPAAGEESPLKLLSSDRVSGYWNRGNDIYYVAADGGIWRIAASGEEKILDQKIPDLSSVNASADGSKAIISFGWPIKPVFAVFEIASGNWTPLPAGIVSADWSPANPNQLAYLLDKGSVSEIGLMNFPDKKLNPVLQISQKGLELDWATPAEIFLKERPSAAASSLWSLNIAAKTVKKVLENETMLMINWFQNNLGLKISKSSLLPEPVTLSLIDKTGKELAAFSFVTLPDKCADNETGIYCAVPSNLNNFFFYPDDYNRREKYFSDDIYFIPLELGINSRLNDFTASIFNASVREMDLDISRPTVKDNKFIFINRYDGRLYELGL